MDGMAYRADPKKRDGIEEEKHCLMAQRKRALFIMAYREKAPISMGQCPFGRRNPSTTAPAPELPEDLVEEILLRFPPSEPASLVRAALVCKQWCRLISGLRFRRSFREFHHHRRSRELFHRTPPPMLGFFCRGILARDGVEATRFVPTSTFCSPRADLRQCRAIDARHGRVLLQCSGKAPSEEIVLVVWDPISDERRELPVPFPTRWRQTTRWRSGWNAAVLCAAAADADGPCDHLDCHRGPFLVVFVDSHCTRNLFTATFSSDSGTWSERIFPLHPADYVSVSSLPCAQVGNALYFASETSGTALKYDLCLHKTSVILIPPMYSLVFPYVLTATKDGRLRYTVLHRSKLYMWSRVDGSEAFWTRWTQDRIIDLKTLLRRNAIRASPLIVGFADGAGVIFLTADDVLFTVDVNTKKVKKVFNDRIVDSALPYMSFYTPALGASFRGEGPSEAGSNE